MTPTMTKPPPGRPKGMPFSKDDPKRQQKLLVGGIGGAALVIAIVLAVIFRPWHTPVPRLNDEPYKLAQLAASSDFNKIPFEQREVYMKMMDHKRDIISQAYASGKITDVEYRKALEAAHLGKHLALMRKFYERAPGPARDAYLDKVLDKRDKKRDTRKHNTDAKQEKKEQDLLRDDSDEDIEIGNWPADVQTQWKTYRAALADRKKAHKESGPTSRPSTLKTGGGHHKAKAT